MYHVMIVDDELYARTRLKVDVCLERDGFLVDREAANGHSAYRYAYARYEWCGSD